MARKDKVLAECDVQILDSIWRCRLLPSATFKRLHKDCTAITVFGDKHIDIDVKQFQLELLGHELSHIYYDSLPIESTRKITVDDLEEILCSFVGKYNTVIYEKKNYIFNKFREQYPDLED